MAKLMKLDDLIKIVACVGIVLEPVDSPKDEDLYVYATDKREGQHSIYVGMTKAGEAGKRHRDEQRIATSEYKFQVQSGFAALIQENKAVRHSFRFDPESFDPTLLMKHIEDYSWKGKAVNRLTAQIADGDFHLSVADVEHILIRTHICTGRLIGNSRAASQWEHKLDGANNLIAVIAAQAARDEHDILPDGTVIDKAIVADEDSDEQLVAAQ